MKLKPVRIHDISRILRISSSSLIEFLRAKGYTIIGDYLSPCSSRMVELIQTGMHEGPPFQELIPYILQAEAWEKVNPELVSQLHTPPPPPPVKPVKIEEIERARRPRRKREPKISFSPPATTSYTGRIALQPLDLELIYQMLALDENKKIEVRDYLRRKTILKAISQMEYK
jgi:hypothetical protein